MIFQLPQTWLFWNFCCILGFEKISILQVSLRHLSQMWKTGKLQCKEDAWIVCHSVWWWRMLISTIRVNKDRESPFPNMMVALVLNETTGWGYPHRTSRNYGRYLLEWYQFCIFDFSRNAKDFALFFAKFRENCERKRLHDTLLISGAAL